MKQIAEYLLSKTKIEKDNRIRANDNNIRKLVRAELLNQGPNANLNHIDVNEVTDMSFLFCARTLNDKCLGFEYDNINPDISQWDVSNVTDMKYMFYHCEQFNRNISKWDVSNVTNMEYMFYRCKKFYQDLHDWNAENVKSYSCMFSDKMVRKKKYWPKAFPWE